MDFILQLLECCCSLIHYDSRDSVRFPIMFSLLCIGSSMPQFGTAFVNQQCIWYSKDKVTDGGTLQKTKRQCETTSKCVAQLLTEFESWSNQTNMQTSNLSFSHSNCCIYPCNASVACFQNVRQLQKKPHHLENKQFQSFFRTFWWIFKLCFCQTEVDSKS